MTIKQTFLKAGKQISKHSPAIFTGVGILGYCATAVLAYKSKDKVEHVVEDIEYKQEHGLEVDKVEVVRDLTNALYLPITTAILSTASIVMAHRVQRQRILALSGALAAQQAQNLYFEKKYRKVHGDEAYEKFSVPTEEELVEKEDKNGKKVVSSEEIKKEIDLTIGQWYDQSEHYASDDHSYNVAYIDSVTETLQTKMFQRGTLLLNEVREALGFERIRNGALLGWTTADNFDIHKITTALGDESKGELREQIWVTWSTPRYIYDDVEFNGRYSIY